MEAAELRAIIIERWAVLRQGLRAVLTAGGHPVLGVAATGAEGLDSVRSARAVELVILGHTDDHDVVHMVRAVCATAPDARVLVLTDRADRAILRSLLAGGASGILGRLAEGSGILDALRCLQRGERVLSNEVVTALLGPVQDHPVGAPVPTAAGDGGVLTAREHEVLVLLATGASNRELASSLYIGEATVKSHLASIYAKLDVPNRHRAVARALELGLVGSVV